MVESPLYVRSFEMYDNVFRFDVLIPLTQRELRRTFKWKTRYCKERRSFLLLTLY